MSHGVVESVKRTRSMDDGDDGCGTTSQLLGRRKSTGRPRRSCETVAEYKLANIVESRVATKASVHGTHGKRRWHWW